MIPPRPQSRLWTRSKRCRFTPAYPASTSAWTGNPPGRSSAPAFAISSAARDQLQDASAAQNEQLRVEWIEGKVPRRAFVASVLWHVAIVMILLLPIWGFLAHAEPTLTLPRIQLTYVPTQDLRADFPTRTSAEAQPDRRSGQAAPAQRRRRVPSAANDSFRAAENHASAADFNSARRAGRPSKNGPADAQHRGVGGHFSRRRSRN